MSSFLCSTSSSRPFNEKRERWKFAFIHYYFWGFASEYISLSLSLTLVACFSFHAEAFHWREIIFYCSPYIEQDLQPNYDSLSFAFPFLFSRFFGAFFPRGKIFFLFMRLWLSVRWGFSLGRSLAYSRLRMEFNKGSFSLFRPDFISFVDLRFNFLCQPV